jgi:hypothetical protein
MRQGIPGKTKQIKNMPFAAGMSCGKANGVAEIASSGYSGVVPAISIRKAARMDRRSFLATTALAGAGLVAATRRAGALSLGECEQEAGSKSCEELARHRDLRARIDEALKQQGVSADERQRLLAASTCPFCGQLILAAAEGEGS